MIHGPSLKWRFYFLFIYAYSDRSRHADHEYHLIFQNRPYFRGEIYKIRKLAQYVHFQESDSAVSPLRDVALELVFLDSSTKMDSYHVISRVIKAWAAYKKNQLEKDRDFRKKLSTFLFQKLEHWMLRHSLRLRL